MTTNNPLSHDERETLNFGLGGSPSTLERAVDRIATARATAALRDSTQTICAEFVDTGKCGHTDVEHDALVDRSEVREAERTAEHWEGLWQVAIKRAEAAERKVAAADILRKRWARDARDGESRGSSYALTYREAANELRAALRDEATP